MWCFNVSCNSRVRRVTVSHRRSHNRASCLLVMGFAFPPHLAWSRAETFGSLPSEFCPVPMRTLHFPVGWYAFCAKQMSSSCGWILQPFSVTHDLFFTALAICHSTIHTFNLPSVDSGPLCPTLTSVITNLTLSDIADVGCVAFAGTLLPHTAHRAMLCGRTRSIRFW